MKQNAYLFFSEAKKNPPISNLQANFAKEKGFVSECFFHTQSFHWKAKASRRNQHIPRSKTKMEASALKSNQEPRQDHIFTREIAS